MAAPQVVPPPYAPELNPVARFFWELRRSIEGWVCPTLQVQKEVLAPVLEAWQADPERVRRLCCWPWIRKARKDLPTDAEVA